MQINRCVLFFFNNKGLKFEIGDKIALWSTRDLEYRLDSKIRVL